MITFGKATDAKANASTDAADGSVAKSGFPATAALGKNAKMPTSHSSAWYGYGQGQAPGASKARGSLRTTTRQ